MFGGIAINHDLSFDNADLPQITQKIKQHLKKNNINLSKISSYIRKYEIGTYTSNYRCYLYAQEG